jgi:hypothetical protein
MGNTSRPQSFVGEHTFTIPRYQRSFTTSRRTKDDDGAILIHGKSRAACTTHPAAVQFSCFQLALFHTKTTKFDAEESLNLNQQQQHACNK